MLDPQLLLNKTFLAHVEHHEVLSSTQDRAREIAAELSVPMPALVISDTQTAGRGRGGNVWWTGGRSLAFSLAFDPAQLKLTSAGNPRVSLAVAVAIVDAIQACTQTAIVGIHWPNDIYAGQRKLAGILVDVVTSKRYVIGVGINTNNSFSEAPPELRNHVATLRDVTGQEVDHTDLLVVILQQLLEVLAQLDDCPERIGRRFDELCLQHGSVLTVRSGSEAVNGVCEGIAADGALLLATDSGRKRIYSGTLR